jgi:thioredoxin 1
MSQSINLYKQLANHKLFNKTINFDLKRIKLILKKLNHPERKLNNVINFLGSSGKFSTLFSVKSFIEANGQTVTAYISPSLKDIKERFWIGNRYLTHQEIKQSIKIIEKFQEQISGDKLSLIQFSASWCGPCQQLKPIIEKISNEKADKIDCYYHDIESQPNEPTKYSVRGVPTVLLFKGSKLLGTKVGATSEKDMLEFITPHL